jgi:hypothetical protein
MSASNTSLPSHQTPTAPTDRKSFEVQDVCDTQDQDCNATPPPSSKTLGSAVGMIWRVIKHRPKILAKRLRCSKHLSKLMSLRIRKVAIPQDQRRNTPEAINVVEATSPPISPISINQATGLEPLARPPAPFAVVAATDSSVSLSSHAEGTPNLGPGLPSHPPADIIHSIDQVFPAHRNSATDISQDSTLQDSTYVHGTGSRSISPDQTPSIEEPNLDPTIDADHPAAPLPLPTQSTQPITPPRLQTDLAQLNVPHPDDRDSQSTIRGRGSSPVDDGDFSLVGSLFEEAPQR